MTLRKSLLAGLGALAMLVGLVSGFAPAYAHQVTECAVSPANPIVITAGGSVVISVTITYTSFSSTDWPMTVTINPISAGYTSNSSTFTDSASGSHTFHLLITNSIAADTSGTGTVSAIWNGGANSAPPPTCAVVFHNTNFPPPPQVPEFPLGLALLMALAIPAMLLVKSKYSTSAK